MKTVKRATQLLKCFADSTRLRIVNLLSHRELRVSELCEILDKKQSLISKHLSQLRMLGVVEDRKEGVSVYYYLPRPSGNAYSRLLNTLTEGFENLQLIKKDAGNLKRLKNGNKGQGVNRD